MCKGGITDPKRNLKSRNSLRNSFIHLRSLFFNTVHVIRNQIPQRNCLFSELFQFSRIQVDVVLENHDGNYEDEDLNLVPKFNTIHPVSQYVSVRSCLLQ